MLKGKKILVGVTGSIAAYKSALLVRLLVKAGSEVRVVMTDCATSFITPLTLSTLSKNKVEVNFSTPDGSWNNHVEAGLWADALVVAPASGNTLAKFANGLCDNLLTAIYLSAKCPVFVAPAMDLDMWKHPATKSNVNRLESHGVRIIPVGSGELASGLEGEGRMAEPEQVFTALEDFFSLNKTAANNGNSTQILKGKKILITAGPTVESIDPVRYISNHSTGKMGFSLAEAFQKMGAEVMIVKGPTPTDFNTLGIKTVSVTNAFQMYEAALRYSHDADVVVMAAAVADYTPEKTASAKIKKHGNEMDIRLVKTPDILKELGTRKKNGQLLVGFALETNDELKNAKNKLKTKNLDLIVLNSLNDEGAGFGYETNKVTLIGKKGKPVSFPLKPKKDVARDIVNAITNLMK